MNGHVLVVDDDRDTRELYKLVFEVAGYTVTEADGVGSAVDAARRVHPDVVLTDWMLGDGDGLALCRTLRRHGPTHRIPVVAATGVTLDLDARERARQLGCEAFLTKPIDLGALVLAVASTLRAAHARTLRAAAIRLRRYAIRVRCNATRSSAARAMTASDLLGASRLRVGSSVALIIADDAGQYLAANDRAAELTGYDPDVLATMSVADLTPAPDLSTKDHLWSSFIDAGTQEGVYLVKRRDGLAVPLQYVAVANIAPGLHLSALRAAPVAGSF
jgi:two-component system cell cycle sensor histidine kinase/response regulator CckA